MLKLGLVLALTLAAGAAAAETTATLNTAVPKPVEVLAGSTLWACADKTCTVKTESVETASWLECRKFVQALGRVTTYAGLEDNKLAMCNAGAKK